MGLCFALSVYLSQVMLMEGLTLLLRGLEVKYV